MQRLAILGDSFTFHGPGGPVPLADARLYPNLVAARLGEATGSNWDVQVVARAGWGLRDAWLALQKDVHLQQQVLLHADAVVLGVGSSDTLSVAVPRWVTMALPYLRPTALRRRVRREIDRWHPSAVRVTRGWWRFTPPSVVRHTFVKSVAALRLFAPQAALVAVLPATHSSVYFGAVTRHHAEVHALLADLADQAQVAVVDLAELTLPWVGRLNVDGVHWPWPLHVEVADAIAAQLLRQLT